MQSLELRAKRQAYLEQERQRREAEAAAGMAEARARAEQADRERQVGPCTALHVSIRGRESCCCALAYIT